MLEMYLFHTPVKLKKEHHDQEKGFHEEAGFSLLTVAFALMMNKTWPCLLATSL